MTTDKKMPFAPSAIAELFEELSATHGEEQTREWFGSYGPITKQGRKIARDAKLLIEYFHMEKPNQQELARLKAKEYGKTPDNMLRYIQRLLNEPAPKYQRIRDEAANSKHLNPYEAFALMTKGMGAKYFEFEIDEPDYDKLR
jgi:hypothetical protein